MCFLQRMQQRATEASLAEKKRALRVVLIFSVKQLIFMLQYINEQFIGELLSFY